MIVEHRQIVVDVFCDVLEKLAFMFGEPATKSDLPVTGNEFVQALVSFMGEITGTLDLAAPTQVCTELAANVLGMDREDEMAVREGTDSIKELLNVTCGNLLSTLAGSGPVFTMSPPVASSLDRKGWLFMLRDPESVAIRVNGSAVLLRLTIGR